MKIFLRKGEHLWSKEGTHVWDEKGFAIVAEEDIELDTQSDSVEQDAIVLQTIRNNRIRSGVDPDSGLEITLVEVKETPTSLVPNTEPRPTEELIAEAAVKTRNKRKKKNEP